MGHVVPRRGRFKEGILENMPDPDVASESVWLPFLRKFFGTTSTRFYGLREISLLALTANPKLLESVA